MLSTAQILHAVRDENGKGDATIAQHRVQNGLFVSMRRWDRFERRLWASSVCRVRDSQYEANVPLLNVRINRAGSCARDEWIFYGNKLIGVWAITFFCFILFSSISASCVSCVCTLSPHEWWHSESPKSAPVSIGFASLVEFPFAFFLSVCIFLRSCRHYMTLAAKRCRCCLGSVQNIWHTSEEEWTNMATRQHSHTHTRRGPYIAAKME